MIAHLLLWNILFYIFHSPSITFNLRICFMISILRILPKKFYGNEESCLLQQEEGATFQLYSYEFRILFSLSHILFVELVSIYCFDFKSSTDCLWLTMCLLLQPRDFHSVSNLTSCTRWIFFNGASHVPTETSSLLNSLRSSEFVDIKLTRSWLKTYPPPRAYGIYLNIHISKHDYSYSWFFNTSLRINNFDLLLLYLSHNK